MNSAKDTVEKLYKGNGKLYFACLLVGTITGAIVSVYRWALEEIGVFRKIYLYSCALKKSPKCTNINIGQKNRVQKENRNENELEKKISNEKKKD